MSDQETNFLLEEISAKVGILNDTLQEALVAIVNELSGIRKEISNL